MGINVNMDYSTLFGSLSGSSSSSNYLSGLSGMLSDYSSIKNGSYGKLVSAYYKKIDNENADSTSKAKEETSKAESTKSKADTEEKKKYSSIASSANNVEKDAEKLTKTGDDSLFTKTWQNVKGEDGEETKVLDYDSSKITSAVSNFVNDYNKMMDSAKDVSDTTTETRASYISKITKSYKSELSSIGISVDDDGKLSLDKDKMKEAGMESVQNVLGKKGGYTYQVSNAASTLESSATRAASSKSTYTRSGMSNTDFSSIMDSFI